MRFVEQALGADPARDSLMPEILTPSQYSDRTRPELVDSPSRRLMLAVFADAISTYQKHAPNHSSPRSRRLVREVETWIDACGDRSPYSFERICAALGIEPAYVKRGLHRWRYSRPNASDSRRIRRQR
jgi:hypothetical protein